MDRGRGLLMDPGQDLVGRAGVGRTGVGGWMAGWGRYDGLGQRGLDGLGAGGVQM